MTSFGQVSPPTNLKPILDSLRVVDKDLAKTWRQEARTKIAVPWAAELAAQAPAGSKGAAAGRSIKAGTGQGVRIYAGKGVWKGWQPFFATNYGMDHDTKHTYLRRSPRGRLHVVRRRVGTWAPEWVPKSDYWFWRYWESHENRIRGRIVTMTNEFMAENL
jgi:hypothetical protein